MEAFVASELLRESVRRHKIHLSLLVADTGLWANPAVHERLLNNTGSAAYSPSVRRAKAGEQPGDIVDGIRLDSNTYANVAIKRAVGLRRQQVEGFEACHIWPLTCYDPRYHTAPANLVLLPRALAGLSDHDLEIQAALQFRALELYGWWPEGFDKPLRPEFYPESWREPLPDMPARRGPAGRRSVSVRIRSVELDEDEVAMLSGRLVRWSTKPNLLVHKAIAIVLQSDGGIPRSELVARVEALTGSANAYGVTAQLFTAASSGYGRVMYDSGGRVRINPALEDVVRSLVWTAG